MRTVQEIYDKAIYLIDAQNENSGSTSGADNREYVVKAPGDLTTLLNECFPYSDTYLDAPEEWDVSVNYAAGDRVTYLAARYVCTASCVGVEPTDTDYWFRYLAEGRRPVHPPVYALTDIVVMDDYICLTVLPYGLAALLLKEEDKEISNFLHQRYEELLARAKATLPASGFEDIENPYGYDLAHGGIEYGWFSEWPW